MVGVILAIVGAMIIPRLAGSSRTTGQLAVEQVTEALATFAFRDSMTSQQVALMRDGETGHLEVWVKDVDQDHPDAPPDWRPDRFMRSIALPEGIELAELVVGSERLAPDEWWIISAPGMERPRIEMRLTGETTDVTVVLDATSNSPYVVEGGRSEAILRQRVDLDRAGRDREPW